MFEFEEEREFNIKISESNFKDYYLEIKNNIYKIQLPETFNPEKSFEIITEKEKLCFLTENINYITDFVKAELKQTVKFKKMFGKKCIIQEENEKLKAKLFYFY